MLLRFDSAADFLAHLDLEDERFFAMRRLVERMRHRQNPTDFLALELDGGTVVGAAAWTPPWPLTVSLWPVVSVPALVAAAEEHGELTAFVGPAEVADAVRAEHRPVTRGSEMIFQVLTTLTPPTEGPGERRLAREDEVTLLAEWLERFAEDVKLPSFGDSTEAARSFVANGRMHFWVEEGRPVAATAHLDYGDDLTHLGMVYVPPSLRGAGRASRLVGAVTAEALAWTARKLTLTDAASRSRTTSTARLGLPASASARRRKARLRGGDVTSFDVVPLARRRCHATRTTHHEEIADLPSREAKVRHRWPRAALRKSGVRKVEVLPMLFGSERSATPPGFNTRRTSRSTASASDRWMKSVCAVTRSSEASSKGNACTSATKVS
ncbi:MAG: GNAT family N-acetyltransferase [Polyangiales bacterium]